MVCGTFKIQESSQAAANQTAALFRANVPPPTSVTVSPTYLVTAVFPPCPADTKFSKKGAVAAT